MPGKVGRSTYNLSSVILLLLSITPSSTAKSKKPNLNCPPLDFGLCSNPGIYYLSSNPPGQSGYLPLNTDDFQHNLSPDIATIQSYICNTLQSPCNAPPNTVSWCRDAFNLYAGLTGPNAADTWNVALGLGPGGPDQNCPYVNPAYVATTTTTVYVAANPETRTVEVGSDILLTTTITTTETTATTQTRTIITDTGTDVVTEIFVVPPPAGSSTLIITLTLPSPSSPPQNPTGTATQTQTVVQTNTFTTETTRSVDGDRTSTFTSTITGSVSSSTTSTSSSATAAGGGGSGTGNENNGSDGDSGGGSPFDQASDAPALRASVGLLSLSGILASMWTFVLRMWI